MAKMKRVLSVLLLALAFVIIPATAEAATRGDAAERLNHFRNFFLDFQQAPDNAIPGDLLADCYGVIIMEQLRAGFVFGGEYGEGVVLLHDRASGDWSAPAFIRSATGNWGLQIGGQQTDAIVLIMNQDGVDMLLNSRFTMGVDASAAAGPVGRNVAAAVGPGTALLTYARARGLFAGATIGGSGMFNNDSMNAALYGGPITVHDIIAGRVRIPEESYGLIDALKSYAVSHRVAPPPYREPAPAPQQQQYNAPQQQQFAPPQQQQQYNPQYDQQPPQQQPQSQAPYTSPPVYNPAYNNNAAPAPQGGDRPAMYGEPAPF